MAKLKTLEQIEQEMRNIEWYYRQTKQEYHDWDLQDRMRYGTLMKMQLRRLEQQPSRKEM